MEYFQNLLLLCSTVRLLLFSIRFLCSVVVLNSLKQAGSGQKCSVKNAKANHIKKRLLCYSVDSDVHVYYLWPGDNVHISVGFSDLDMILFIKLITI